MGAYRFILSLLVLISHLDIHPGGRNVGVSAVISFFVLSGYAMNGLIQSHYNNISRIPFFYVDRILRLFPQFLFYSGIALFLAEISGKSSRFTPSVIIKNFLMFPLGFWGKFTRSDSETMLLPQAWSLGLELCFYIIIPWIMVLNAKRWAFVISFLCFSAACFGIIETDLYIYRYIPGVLFMFMIGGKIFESRKAEFGPELQTTGVALGAVLVYGLFAPLKADTYLPEVVGGLLFGAASIRYLSRKSFSVGIKRYDDLAGNIAYGIFLNHVILIAVAEQIGLTGRSLKLFVLLVTVPFGWLSFVLIERPVTIWRRRVVRSQRCF